MGDRYQEIVASNDGDDLPTSITVLQAQKIANIIAAGRRGHQAYQDATEDVIDFLETAALETLRDNMALGVRPPVVRRRSGASSTSSHGQSPVLRRLNPTRTERRRRHLLRSISVRFICERGSHAGTNV